jgi:hypothetical protein
MGMDDRERPARVAAPLDFRRIPPIFPPSLTANMGMSFGRFLLCWFLGLRLLSSGTSFALLGTLTLSILRSVVIL